jgi:hypothetical protein
MGERGRRTRTGAAIDIQDALQVPMHDLEVDWIDAGGMDLDSDAVGARERIGDFSQADMVADRAIAVENKARMDHACRVEEFWQQQGERGRARRNLFGGPVRPLP